MTHNSLSENTSESQLQLIRESFEKILTDISKQIGRLALATELLSQADSLDNFENPNEIVLCGLKTILDDTLHSYRDVYKKIDKLNSNAGVIPSIKTEYTS